MKQSISGGGGGDGCGCGGWRIPSEEEVEVAEVLLNLPKLIVKSEFKSELRKYRFIWGKTKKRSVQVSKSQLSPSTHRQINESRLEEVTVAEADKSPSTPLCFLPSGSGSDGGADKPKRHSSSKKNSKRKATNDLIVRFNEAQHEREILVTKVKTIKKYNENLRAENLELKRKRQEINPRKMDEIQLWNNAAKINRDQQDYHRQITMSAPPPPPPPPQPLPQKCQQFMVDPNCKVVAVTCSGNSNSGGRFGFFNQMDPRVKVHGVTYDFMGSSQSLDQSKYLVMDNDLRVRTAADARRYRIMRMKENKNSSSAMKVSRAYR